MAAQGIATKTLAETFRDGSAIHGTLCARTSRPSVAEISGICAMLPRNGRENGLSSRRRLARMAERRMFAKTIVLSDAFLDMPTSARCLYFTLGMLADDDGFVNSPRSIMRQCGATDDDMKLLLAKKFALIFDSGVIVIKHWRINNYLRSDRHTATKYKQELDSLAIAESGAYTRSEVGIPSSNQVVHPGKDSLVEGRLVQSNNIYSSSLSNAHTREERIDYLTGRMMDTDNPPTEAEIAEYKRIMRGETDG